MTVYDIAALILGLAFSLAGLVVVLATVIRRRATWEGSRAPYYVAAAILILVGASWLVDLR